MVSAERILGHDVPRELEGLAAYLELEEQPAVIIRETCEKAHVVWASQAFESAGLKQHDIVAAVRAQKEQPLGKETTRGVLEDRRGTKWDIRRIWNGWCVATAAMARLHNSPADAANGPKDAGNPYSLVADGTQTSTEQSGMTNLDWLVSPRLDISSWSRFFLDHDWTSTPLGPINTWSDTLRTHVLSIMINPDPRLIVWNPELSLILYNEAAVPILGDLHPHVLGRSIPDHMPEVWEGAAHLIQAAFAGNLTEIKRFPISLQRSGTVPDECYFNSTLTPIVGTNGTAVGVLDELTETTKLVLGERRRNTVVGLGQRITATVTLKDLWATLLEELEAATGDVAFAILYTLEGEPTNSALGTGKPEARAADLLYTMEGTVGIEDPKELPRTFSLRDDESAHEWLREPVVQAWKGDEMRLLNAQDHSLPPQFRLTNPDRVSGETVSKAVVIPITELAGKGLLGTLILGLSPRCAYDDEYRLYANIFREILGRAAAIISLPIEQRKAQRMAEEVNHALAQQLRLTTLQVEQNEAKFLRLAKYSPTGMFAIDTNGKTVYTNEAYARLVSDENGKPLGPFESFTDFLKAIHPEDVDAWRDHWDKLSRRKTPAFVEFRLRKPWRSSDTRDGKSLTGETWLLATAFPEIEPSGEVSVVLGWVTDVSHQKFAESILSQRLEDALENKRQTEKFLDMHNHEMRNPLSAILQSADAIVTSVQSCGMSAEQASITLPAGLAEELVDSAQTIILCAEHQKRIVDDILTLSKLDASLLMICPDVCEPPALVDKALKMYSSEIERAEIKAEVIIESTYKELNVSRVMMDSSRFLQVVINLLTNAIKFLKHAETRNLTINLGASYARPTGKHHGVNFVPTRRARPVQTPGPEWGTGEDLFLQVAVVDTGSGITTEEMKLLFERFAQASPKTYKQYGGSGLGLFISRELCELQGGQIGVCSRDGRTAFTFYVRVKRWVPDKVADMPRLTRFVSASSSPVAFSRRGSEVLGLAYDAAPQDPNGGAEVSIDGIAEQRLTPQAKASAPAKLVTTETHNVPGHMHVLLVEDNFINQKVMSQQLRKAGLTVHVANHGLECLDFVSKSSFSSPPSTPNADNPPPAAEAITPLSIILLDLEMPVMGGIDCVRHIRERQLKGEIAGHIPIIAVTANARSEQINHAIEAGMDQVVTKPFRIPELVPQMHKLIAEVSLKAAG